VLSHFDFDHVGGIEGLDGVEIGKVLVSGFDDQRRAVDQVANFLSERGIEPQTGYRGMSEKFGQGFWEVISPSASASEASNANDASLVMLITLPQTQLLAMGDLGGDFQEKLIQQGLEGRLNQQLPLILKASHHGSADQSERFHRVVDPEVSVISVGENTYGHPDARFISLLQSTGSKVFRTDQQGMIGIQSGPELRVFVTGRL
jgi:Predicted hydrolase (metallo-beta-lactamase superfamily)